MGIQTDLAEINGNHRATWYMVEVSATCNISFELMY